MKEKFKHIIKVVEHLARSNDLPIKPFEEWPRDSGYCFFILNNMASLMSDEELDIFIDGDQDDAKVIADKYGIYYLNNFLNNIFDGKLHWKFFN